MYFLRLSFDNWKPEWKPLSDDGWGNLLSDDDETTPCAGEEKQEDTFSDDGWGNFLSDLEKATPCAGEEKEEDTLSNKEVSSCTGENKLSGDEGDILSNDTDHYVEEENEWNTLSDDEEQPLIRKRVRGLMKYFT